MTGKYENAVVFSLSSELKMERNGKDLAISMSNVHKEI